MYKIIGADGKEYGPISAEVLRQWITEGRANAQTRVLVEGTTEWKRLEELPEFSAGGPGNLGTSTTPGTISPVPTEAKVNSLAITGFILGIISMTFALCCYGVPFNVAGMICSGIALAQIQRDPQRERGQGLAIAGLVLSVLSLLLALVIMVFHFRVGTHDWMRHMRHL